MTTIQEVDIPLVLNYLRPGSAYHWRGAGQFGNSYEAIGEWRDSATEPPVEQEIIDAWDNVIVPADAVLETYRQDIKGRYQPLIGQSVAALSNAELVTLLEAWGILLDGIDLKTGLIQRPAAI